MKILYLAKYPQPIKTEDYSSKIYPDSLFGFYQLKNLNDDIVWYSHPRKSAFYKFLKKHFASIDSFYFQFTCLGIVNKYDLIYVGEDYHLFILAVFRALKLIRRPIFSVSHFTYNTQYITNTLKKTLLVIERFFVFRYIDKISFASEKLLELAIRDNDVPQRHRNIAFWGANIDYYDPNLYDVNATEEFFLATGGNNRDYETLVECFKHLPKEKLQLNAKYKEFDKDVPNNICVEKAVYFDANKKLEQRSQMYNCIAVLIPIKKINQVPNGATVMVEAMAMGKPVLISDLETNFVDVEKEGIGLKVKMGDVNDWIRVIEWIKNHPEERRKMGEKAYLLSKNKYNIEKCANIIFQQMKEMFNDYA